MVRELFRIFVVVNAIFNWTLSWSGVTEGIAAYDNGDNVTALKEFKRAAEQGNAKAQFKLGAMYSEGQGVAQDYKEAFKWFSRSAEQGDTEA